MSAMAKIRGFVVALALASAGQMAHAQTTDFWGTRLPDQPTQFIFGYGSLINTPSRESTAGKPVAAIPVREDVRDCLIMQRHASATKIALTLPLAGISGVG